MTTYDAKLDDWIDGKRFKDFDHPFVIAGGCLRDTYFNKDVVDVDVFIGIADYEMTRIREARKFRVAHVTDCLQGYLFVDGLPDYGDDEDLYFDVDGDPDYENKGFISGRCATMPGLNIILREVKDEEGVPELVEMLFKEFPCSISKIAYSPMEDKLYVDDSFYESAANNTIQFYDADEKYIKKIIPKYKEFKQVYNTTAVFLGGSSWSTARIRSIP